MSTMSHLHRQAATMLTHSQQARNPLPTLMESEAWESPPTPPPKDACYAYSTTDNTAMDGDRGSAPATPASSSKRKRAVQDFDDTLYERRNGRVEAGDGDQDKPTPQKRSRSRSHAGGRSNSTYSEADDVTRLRRKRGFGNLSNMNLRHHAAASAFRGESPTRESRFQEGSLNDKPSQQPPSLFTRMPRTDSGNLQQVDELMNDYHEGIVTPRDSTEAYEKATIEYEKATMPARVAEMTEQRKKETGKHGMFRFGKSLTNTFHPVQLWNRMWSESKEELIAKNRLEAERKAREKAEIQARYDQMKRDGQFNTQQVSFAGASRVDTNKAPDIVMVDDGYEAGDQHRADSRGYAGSVAGSEANEAVPTTATKNRFLRLHFKTPSISDLKDTFRGVRNVQSHSALGGAVGRDSCASVSPAKANVSTLKRSVSKFDLKKERRLSNRVSDLESKLNKARLELKNALDDASPMPKLSGRYERFTPVGTMKRSRFVPGALPTLPSERLLFPGMSASDANSEQQGRSPTSEATLRNTLDRNVVTDKDKAFDEEEYNDEESVKAPREVENPTHAAEVFQPSELDSKVLIPSTRDNGNTLNTTLQTSTESTQVEEIIISKPTNTEDENFAASSQPPRNDALAAKLSALEASYKASNKPKKSKKRKSAAADDEKPYRPDGEAEESESEETVSEKKRKSGGKTAGTDKKKSGKAGRKTIIPVAVVEPKGKKGNKVTKAVDSFFTNGYISDDGGDSPDELATAVPASADSDAQSLQPVYEEEEQVTTVPLKDEPSKPTAMSTPARYGCDGVSSHPSSPHKNRSDSLQPGQVAHQRRSVGRSPPAHSKTAEVVDGAFVAVPGQNGVPRLPAGAQDKSNWAWPADVF